MAESTYSQMLELLFPPTSHCENCGAADPDEKIKICCATEALRRANNPDELEASDDNP